MGFKGCLGERNAPFENFQKVGNYALPLNPQSLLKRTPKKEIARNKHSRIRRRSLIIQFVGYNSLVLSKIQSLHIARCILLQPNNF
jgi:hypothetical protein